MTFFSRKQPLAEKKKKKSARNVLTAKNRGPSKRAFENPNPPTDTDTDTGKYSLSHQFGKTLKRRPQGRELQKEKQGAPGPGAISGKGS